MSKFQFFVVNMLVMSLSAFAWPHMAGSGAEHPVVNATAELLLTGSRQEKLKDALLRSEKTEYKTIPEFSGGLTEKGNFFKFATESMNAAFDHPQDFLVEGRRKYIHPVGSVAPVKFVPAKYERKYSGLFNGADSCIARLSLGSNPEKSTFSPGMAIKCYRDGPVPSGNFISMYSLKGQPDSRNFFAHEFSNIIDPITSGPSKLVQNFVFGRASRCPNWISLRQFASIDQFGKSSSISLWPQQIFLVPSGVSFPEADDVKSIYHKDFRHQLAALAPGSKLWDVYAADRHGDADRFKIGEIITTGVFRASSWSDTELYFQHDRGEWDNCPNTK